MDAIETLMNEHRLIERVCDALTGFADTAARRAGEDKEELGRFVTFISRFADGWHHGKEEDILFAAMADAGFSRQAGPVAVMLMEHDRGRAYVAELRRLSEQSAQWSEDDRRALLEAAHGYSSLLHNHIHKEDAILYPMAEQHLPAEALDRVNSDCTAYEASRTGDGEHERLHAIADDLVKRHGAGTPGPRSIGCCG
ncbi:MAG TPA: hemerythrin domain-containing protein [Anaeromyxobacteraceae bacterium]|nr:hemerythrin domain-containing protein [Anaeromyxobacteraceae bacterium]